MESFRKSVSFRELEEDDSHPEENPLKEMFENNASRTLNSAELTYEEFQPSARWALPDITPSEVYCDLAPFHLIAASRISIKESVSQVQENSESIQTIPLLNPQALQAEAKKLKTNYLHLGCIRVGINPLVHKGLKTFVLATVRDLTHNRYTDSIIGGIVASLSDGPVYFDCFPNFSIYVFDETIKDILQLQIHTTGFDMKRKRNNIAIQTKACFRHTNTLWPAIRHTPSRDSKSSVVVKTDPKNQKIEHLLIKWENLQFP